MTRLRRLHLRASGTTQHYLHPHEALQPNIHRLQVFPAAHQPRGNSVRFQSS